MKAGMHFPDEPQMWAIQVNLLIQYYNIGTVHSLLLLL